MVKIELSILFRRGRTSQFYDIFLEYSSLYSIAGPVRGTEIMQSLLGKSYDGYDQKIM